MTLAPDTPVFAAAPGPGAVPPHSIEAEESVLGAMLLSDRTAVMGTDIVHVWAACVAAEAVARRVLAQVAEAEDAG